MRIAQLAPLWEPVPPKTYGGTELVVHNLCEEFTKRGHDVTLFASGDSTTSANLIPIIPYSMRETGIEFPILYELKSISKVLELFNEFDIIHNHLGLQLMPFIKFINKPVITTLHGAFVVEEEKKLYKEYKNMPFISISDSQRFAGPELNYIATVYNGIQIDKYPFQEKPKPDKPYLAFLGRMSVEKGPHLAIKLAKETGQNLIMAGKISDVDMSFYEEFVLPHIDGEQITFIGELGHKEKVKLLKNASATLHPVTWPEPFGLVMAESMACGTPVLALNQGSIPEVIKDKVTGFIENDIDALIKHVKDIDKIDRKTCRKHVEENFSVQMMTNGYLSAYRKIITNEPLGKKKPLEISHVSYNNEGKF